MQGILANWQKKAFSLHPLSHVLHPRAPSPCVLGVTVGVLIREVHRHRVFVVELKAGKELFDDVGVFFRQVISFFWVLVNVEEPEGLGGWVRGGDLRNVVLRRRREPVTTAWQRQRTGW